LFAILGKIVAKKILKKHQQWPRSHFKKG
jgi:hypothetical protein